MDRSIDSIGSCSLDVDADSTDFSDTSESLNFLTPQSQKEFTAGITERVKQRIQQPLLTPKLILQQPKQQQNYQQAPVTSTAYFDINSGKINTILSKAGSDYSNGGYFYGNGSEYSEQTIELASPQINSNTKKPSYLNLACCVNGYSDFTSYKSREVSPNRPIIMSRQQRSNDNLMTVPNVNYVRTSPLASMTKRFTALTIQDQKDQVDNASNSAEKILSRKSFIQQRVEKLYGSQEHTSPKIISYVTRRSTDTLIVTNGTNGTNGHTNGHTNGTNGSQTDEKENEENEENLNSLPVMRLLRPEFCKQLQFSSPKKSLLTSSKSNNCVTTTTTITNTKSAAIKTSYSVDTIESESDKVMEMEKERDRNSEPSITCLNSNSNSNSNSNVTCLDRQISSYLENSQNLKNLNLVEKLNNCQNNKMVVSDHDVSMENKENCKKNGVEMNGVENGHANLEEKQAPVKKDGHYFLDILNRERSRLLHMADVTENEMKTVQEKDPQVLSEEVIGLLLSAIGKSRLLATKKMKQFEGLCNTNLNPPEGETFTTKDGDLQGFWDMVMLQVNDVDAAFENIQKCKENGWVKPKPPSPQLPRGAKLTKRPLSQSQAAKGRSTIPVKKSAPTNTAAQQKREEQRKKLMELKRKQKAAISSQVNGDDVVVEEPMDADMKTSTTSVETSKKENDVEIFL